MKIALVSAVLLAVPVVGQPPPGYYDPTYLLSGEPLRMALRDIIDNHFVASNASLWQHFASTDDRPDGTVWDIYSDVAGPNDPYVFNFIVDECGTYDSEADCFNREHSFPQSWFNQAAPMTTDLHHVYPTDAWVNQKRGNFAYGEVNNPTWTSQNGGKLGPCALPNCGNGNDVFEPIDLYKGDLARSYFYMLTRYMDQTDTWTTCPMLSGGEFSPWAETMLLNWHTQDPVDAKEVDRNNAVFAIQQNRNPFIDNPQWAYAIWGPSAGVQEPLDQPVRMTIWDGRLFAIGSTGQGRFTIVDALGRTEQKGTLQLNGPGAVLAVPGGIHVALLDVEGALRVLQFVLPER